MPMNISFELSNADLEHFCGFIRKAREAASGLDTEHIVANARKVLDHVYESGTSDFIRDRMHTLETLIGMVEDDGWGLADEDLTRAVNALAYFSESEDLIPDHIPGLGFLDDAIMIQMMANELKHEIQAYRDFIAYRDAEAVRPGNETAELNRADWLEERRQQLHLRMRRRRRGGRKSPFSLL